MNICKRVFAAALLTSALSAVSSAVVFVSPVVTGSTDGAVSYIGSNGINFSLADWTVRGGSTKRGTISYEVKADAGYVITGVTVGPLGFVRSSGLVDSEFAHNVEGNVYSVTNAGFQSLPNKSYSLRGSADYKVSFDWILNSLEAQKPTSVASMTQLSVIYTQTAVPEPTTIGVLGIGLFGMIARKRKGGN